ncbi:MAG: hypothetical protein IJP49_06340 [Bacteroidales bacterium]|nr:hypothetical protein [Bacteroidales bacterium]
MANVIGHKDPLLRLDTLERYWLHKIVGDAVHDAKTRREAWESEKMQAEIDGRMECAESYGMFAEIQAEREAALRSISAALDVLQTRLYRAPRVYYKKRGGVSHV